MNKAIIILSTRQLTQVNFTDKHLKDYDLILIASKEEHEELPQSISKIISLNFTVSIETNDGVIKKYVRDEIVEFIESIKGYYFEINFVCFDEGNVVLADSLRNNDESYASLDRFRDKVLMKSWLKDKDILIPLFIESLKKDTCYNNISDTIGIPFVIKPKESAGSNNIFIIQNENEFLDAKRTIGSMLNNYEAEEYIEGSLYHCDTALWQGKPVFSECTKYLSPTIDFQSGTPLGGHIMDQSSLLRTRLIAFSQKVLAALDSKDGVYHMEIFVQSDKEKQLVFLEVGARPPGMLVTSMYEEATGINLLNLDILIQTGSVPIDFNFSRKKHAFYLVYPKGKGYVDSLNIPELDKSIEVRYSCDVTIGEKHIGCSSNLDYCAHILCSSIEDSLLRPAYKQLSTFKPVKYCS